MAARKLELSEGMSEGNAIECRFKLNLHIGVLECHSMTEKNPKVQKSTRKFSPKIVFVNLHQTEKLTTPRLKKISISS